MRHKRMHGRLYGTNDVSVPELHANDGGKLLIHFGRYIELPEY